MSKPRGKKGAAPFPVSSGYQLPATSHAVAGLVGYCVSQAGGRLKATSFLISFECRAASFSARCRIPGISASTEGAD